MQLGALSTAEILGPRDFFFRVTPSVSCPANSVTPITVGSFVMPFTGSLVADIHLRVSVPFNSNNFVRPHLASSSPAPNAYSYHGWWGRGSPSLYGAWSEVPVTAIWNSVAKNTTVTLIVTVVVGPGSTVTAIQTGGLVHAYQ